MKAYLSGNQCIAHGAKLSRIELMCAYPITPATPASEAIYEMIDSGEMDAKAVNAESEGGAMSIISGASMTGCRAFTCTCSQGLALMKEMLWATSGLALPVVIATVSRSLGNPAGGLPDYSDCLSERDSSYLQFFCENGQEIVDSIIMAYKISENDRVLLPSFVNTEGFNQSHTYELVDLPEQEEIDKFLPRYYQPKHIFVDTNYPVCTTSPGMHYPNYKWQQYTAMQEAKVVIKEVGQEYGKRFGRYYDLVEAYKTEDAEFIVVGMGSIVGLLREKVDEHRQKGIKLGLLKLRVFRPFPEDELRKYLSGAKKILVIDRAISPGNKNGVAGIEVKAALQKSQADISNTIISGMIYFDGDIFDVILKKWIESEEEFTEWHRSEFDQQATTVSGYDNYAKLVNGEKVQQELVKEGEDLLCKGISSCAGCTFVAAMRNAFKVLGKDTVIVNHGGCSMAIIGAFPLNPWRVPHMFTAYSHLAGTASGIELGLKIKGINAHIAEIAGDGAFYDIGLQTFSAALERGHRVIYFCYDNEAYMNTGIQRSGSTPYMAKTKTTLSGKRETVKNLEDIVAAHGDVYIATASPAYMDDLVKKVNKAKDLDKPCFIHINTPCPPGWEFDPALGIEIARLGVETGAVVLYERDNGNITVNKVPKKRKPIEEYLTRQGRFSHLTKADIVEIQKQVDENFRRLTCNG